MFNFKTNKGFSMVSLMAVVLIIGILATISLPIYNQHIEKTKVAKELPSIGNYKQGVVSCFMKNDSLENCDSGKSGIPEGLNDFDNIISLDVNKGVIKVIINAENHLNNVSPIELHLSPVNDLTPDDSAFDWDLFCNDYDIEQNALVKECKGLLNQDNSSNENNDAPPSSSDWEALEVESGEWRNTGSQTLGEWTPEINGQSSGFEQTRVIRKEQERTLLITERNSETQIVRVREEVENKVVEEVENRWIDVTSGEWTDIGTPYNCSNWTLDSTNMLEVRTCYQYQEKETVYASDNNVITSTVETDVNTVEESRQATGEWQEISRKVVQNCDDWSPETDTVDMGVEFQQTRTCYNTITTESEYMVGNQVVDTKTEVDESSYVSSRTAYGTYTVTPDCRGESVIYSTYPYYTVLSNDWRSFNWGVTDVLYIWGDIEFQDKAVTENNPIEYQGYNYWAREGLAQGYFFSQNGYVNGHYREHVICRTPTSN